LSTPSSPPPPSSLVPLGARARQAGPETVVGLLLDCHQRIRRFSALAIQLANAPAAPPAEVRDAAERVHRYFTLAFPLHVADEELSLRPRLLRHPIEAPVRQALETMSREHLEGEALLPPLVERWASWARDPDPAAARGASLQAAEQLERLLRQHLQMEETLLFPALTRWLGEAELAEVQAEMRGRRER